jgi:hypothetical protein
MVLNVMLVENKGVYAERVALGQIDRQVWADAHPKKKCVLLG